MKAFHAFWSAPGRARRGGDIVWEDYELLTMMLSALEWRKENGAISMLTDSAGAAFFERSGLAGLWDGGLDTALDGMEPAIDPVRFWAAGKLAALRLQSAPCVMLDTDLILWRDVRARLSDHVVAAHTEPLEPEIYPQPSAVFSLCEGYSFPPEWDFSLPAANTAFLYLPDDALRTSYTEEAFRFMRSLRDTRANTSVTMCFAEQRLLPMCAKARGIAVDTLLPDGPWQEQSFITHLWGYKRTLAHSQEKRAEYCLRCTLRLLADFPEWEGALAANEQTRRYLL